MTDILIRASSVGKIMVEPRSKAEGILSKGARTYIRGLARQEILGIEDVVTSKEIEKGVECEPESIALLNRVLGTFLTKNTERRNRNGMTGECDLFNKAENRGHDLKTSWCSRTWPAFAADAEDPIYEWQMRTYMMLWDADEWEVDYALVSTPEHLIRYEDPSMHIVDHIPEPMRLTRWIIKRDLALERKMIERVAAAREYLDQSIREFDEAHKQLEVA